MSLNGSPSYPGELDPETLLDGRYEIRCTLGRGGFAFTYEAHDRNTGGPVTIKEVFPRDCKRTGRTVEALSPEAEEILQKSPRWIRKEAEILKGFKDPSIVEVHRTFEEHQTIYVVMQFIDGLSLEQEAQAGGERLPASEVRGRLGQILSALRVVHENGVLHQDLKPSNVMCPNDGRIVLIDFGAARENLSNETASTLATLTLMFTPAYAAPEQRVPGEAKTFATDLFAVGAIGFRLLTGAPPYMSAQARPPEIEALIDAGHSQLVRTIGWALEPKPENRPTHVASMLEALEGFKEPEHGMFDGPRRRVPRPPPQPKPKPAPRPKPKPWFSRRKPKELSDEARRLATRAQWPVAALAATPGLIIPFLTGLLYLAAIALMAALVAARKELRTLGKRRLTSATVLFLLPRLVGRVPGWILRILIYLFLGLLLVALLAALGAVVAALYAAIGVLLHGQHLDHASLKPGFKRALPRAIVSVPVAVLLASLMGGEKARVRRLVTAAAGVTESSVVALWALGFAVPVAAVLLSSCHTWAPFPDYEQALAWVEARVPLVVDVDNEIVRVSIRSQVHRAVGCATRKHRYVYKIDRVGKRSFLVTVDLDRHAVETTAKEPATNHAGNAERQVGIVVLVMGRLDMRLPRRVRKVTVVEGNLSRLSGKLALSDEVLKMTLSRPHGPVSDGTVGSALITARTLYANPTLGVAADRLDGDDGRTLEPLGVCG